MKSFRYFTEYVNSSVPAFSVGGASSGPGMGQYVPVADLNAQKKKQRRTKQDPDIKDSPGTEPAKYYAKDASGKGMAKSTKQARDRHFTKGAAKDDDDPSAYKPAPGDKGAKTKLSKYTKKYRQMYGEEPRIPRKKGQPAGSDKHSDLYTDENPKGTIHGLGFKDVETARASVKKIESSGKTHAHKIQAAIAMEQRARVMGKTAEANVYRAYIEKMKKITKQKNEDFTQKDVNDLEKFADRILAKYGIDIEFTRHFVDRLNDPRNSPAIKVSELQKFFKKIQRNKGRNILANPDTEAVLKDMSTNLNLPVVIKTKGDDSFEVTNKTIMRKKDFRTTSKVINYEDGHTAIAKTNASQKRELERLKIKHDREDDRARAQDTARKNQETESLWDNIRKKKERIKRGSGERMRKPGEKGAPTPAQMQRAKGD